MILIISTADDVHVDLVVNELSAIGANWVRFNTEDFPQHVQLELEYHNGLFSGSLYFKDLIVDISDIRSIWYRRPEPPKISQEVVDPQAREIAEAESSAALRGLWSALYDRFWMSWPMNIRRAEQKLFQLRIASELGFIIPPTLITQCPDGARRFYKEMGSKVAVKTLSGIFIEGPPHRVIYTNLIKDEHLTWFHNVQVCPTLFQRYIYKAVELRITVVNKSVFAAEMHTQVDLQTSIDWRRGSPVSVPHYSVILPPAIEKRCIELVQRFGLTFGSIDMIRTPEGEYVFLELNSNGQWAWIQGLTGMEISKKIAEILQSPPEFQKNF